MTSQLSFEQVEGVFWTHLAQRREVNRPTGQIEACRMSRMSMRNESQRMSGFRCRTKRGAGQVVRRSPKKAPNQMASRRESVHFPQRAYSLTKATRRTQWRHCDAAMTLCAKTQPTPPAIGERGRPGKQEDYDNRSKAAASPSQVHG